MTDSISTPPGERPTAILFVCLGNICRSPLAEGIFRAVAAEHGLAQTLHLDSAGVGAWHIGAPPDPRAIATAHRFGLDITGQRARRVSPEDLLRFDLVFGMDRSNVAALKKLAPAKASARIHLFLDYALGRPDDVPDPYYGADDGFAAVYRTLHEASEALAARLSERAGSARSKGQASSMI
ncbi:low molecular weight protein-tyrosine-phosphatase [Chelativorans sp. M5D2P16]|uniref:low molecular weight protein-tyrosine-phosphatase n=1 Tax=Chelativorans sp. M5D2P16 TaxID=3095678 RepID=UPI002ACAF560|nr:low molecular weight protein-tyrosine-phosphatase [Chelativorans sp. M5D2P16]MDZ5699219.1 low molecular weight protein-tyrosine-phosphatase [Chelativorans sp. M5D2P16]